MNQADMEQIWAKAHGAVTHFPIALTLCSVALDGAGFVLGERLRGRELHAAGYWTLLLAALGAVAAVFSGLLMTRGSVVGVGAVRLHHLFGWPAFGLLVALATWRAVAGREVTRPAFAGYLVVVAITAGLIAATGYWGGELMIAG